MQDWRRTASLNGHVGTVRGLSFRSDRLKVVSGSEDGDVRIWSVKGCESTLKGHLGAVCCIDFNPSGNNFASGGEDGDIRIWRLIDPDCVSILRSSEGACSVDSIAFSPCGDSLVASGRDGRVRLWQCRPVKQRVDQPIITLQGHGGAAVHSVAWSMGEGRVVASGGEDHTIRLFDPRAASHGGGNTFLTEESPEENVEERFNTIMLKGHSGGVRSVAFSPQRSSGGNSSVLLLASGGGVGDHTLRVWDVETQQCIRVIQGHTAAVESVAFNPLGEGYPGAVLVSGSRDKTVRVWDLRAGDSAMGAQCTSVLEGHQGEVRCVAFNPNGKQIISGGSDNNIHLWNPVLSTSSSSS